MGVVHVCPHRYQHTVRMVCCKIILLCLGSLVSAAPAPQPFIDPYLIPTVARSLTEGLPPLVLPTLGLTIVASQLFSVAVAKGVVLAGLAAGSVLGKRHSAAERRGRHNYRWDRSPRSRSHGFRRYWCNVTTECNDVISAAVSCYHIML